MPSSRNTAVKENAGFAAAEFMTWTVFWDLVEVNLISLSLWTSKLEGAWKVGSSLPVFSC